MKSISIFSRNSINYGITQVIKATAVFPNGYLNDSSHKRVELELVGQIPKSEYSEDYVGKWGYSSDFIQGSVKYQSGTSESGKFSVGSAVISELSFTLNNNHGKFDGLDFRGAYLMPYGGIIKIAYSNWLFTEAGTDDTDSVHVMSTEDDQPLSAEFVRVNDTLGMEWLYLGTFYFVTHKTVGNVINCETYDQLKFTDEYNILADDNIQFPITAGELVNKICSARGMVVANQKFDGYNTVLQVAPQNDITERQALAYVGQLTGNYVKMGVLPDSSNDRLIIDWYDTESTLTEERRFSHSLETSPVTITGVTVHANNSGNDAVSYTYPVGADKAEGRYIIDISNNPWIVDTNEDNNTTSNVEEVAKRIAAKTVGLTLCPGSLSIFNDISIEAGDTIKAKTDSGDEYINFIVTNLSYSFGVSESITCDAETVDQSDLRQTALSNQINFAKTEFGKKLTNYQAMSNMFSRLAKESLGLFKITKRGDDGSTITYYASRPTLEEIRHGIVWTLTRSAVQCCNDYVYGDDAWNAQHLTTGITTDGQALAQTLTAVGLNADWLNVGKISTQNNNKNYWNLETGEFSLTSDNNSNTYITRDSKGNLLIAASSMTAGTINGTSISGGTIVGSDFNNGNGTFHVDKNGALTATSATITGNITATSGKIGGFSADGTHLWNGNTGMYSANGNAFYAGTPQNNVIPFYVTQQGILHATGANVSGTINASAGYIGALSINSYGFAYNKNSISDSRFGIWVGSDGISLGTTTGKQTSGLGIYVGYYGRDEYVNIRASDFGTDNVYSTNIFATGIIRLRKDENTTYFTVNKDGLAHTGYLRAYKGLYPASGDDYVFQNDGNLKAHIVYTGGTAYYLNSDGVLNCFDARGTRAHFSNYAGSTDNTAASSINVLTIQSGGNGSISTMAMISACNSVGTMSRNINSVVSKLNSVISWASGLDNGYSGGSLDLS